MLNCEHFQDVSMGYSKFISYHPNLPLMVVNLSVLKVLHPGYICKFAPKQLANRFSVGS